MPDPDPASAKADAETKPEGRPLVRERGRQPEPRGARVPRGGGRPGFKYLVTAWSIEATGGPKVYAGRDMEEAHLDLEVTDREFDIVHTAIEQSLHQADVPEQEEREFMDIIESYRDMVVYDRDYEEDPGYVESPATYGTD